MVALWEYLISATGEEIAAIPLLEFGQKIESLGLDEGPSLLLSCWVNTSPFRKQMSGWKAKDGISLCGMWCAKVRDSIAEQVDKIRHWKVVLCDYRSIGNTEATWFIDPPYQSLQEHYRESRRNPIDFGALSQWCQSRDGQAIVCEKEGASWLPFRYLGQASAARGTKKCSEFVWTNQPDGVSPTIRGPMTLADQLNVPAFLETVARQCAVKIALPKAQLIKLVHEDARREAADVEVDRFLMELVRAGHLRTSGGRFWTPKKP